MKTKTVQIVIIAISILVSMIAYYYLPETIASHWNAKGDADGYSSKLSYLIAFPSLITLLYLFLLFIPKLDPLKKNIEEFQTELDKFITLVLGFLLIIHLQVVLWNMGTQIPFHILFPTLLGILMYQIGDLLGKSKKNWSIGIKTPWTISNAKVWNKTHKLGEKLFKLSLPLFLLSILFPDYSFIIVIAYTLGISLFLCYYSHKMYPKN